MSLPFFRDMVGEKLGNGQKGSWREDMQVALLNKNREELKRGKRVGLICNWQLVQY
jgi:hypothetical protein